MVILALLLSLVSQLAHSVIAYLSLAGSYQGMSLLLYIPVALCFSLGVSFSILILTLRGDTKKAYIYLGFEFLINLVFYKTYLVIMESPVQAVVQILFGFIMPYTISCYSDIVKKIKEQEKEDISKHPKVNYEAMHDASIKFMQEDIAELADKVDKVSSNEHLRTAIAENFNLRIGDKVKDKDRVYEVALEDKVQKENNQNSD